MSTQKTVFLLEGVLELEFVSQKGLKAYLIEFGYLLNSSIDLCFVHYDTLRLVSKHHARSLNKYLQAIQYLDL